MINLLPPFSLCIMESFKQGEEYNEPQKPYHPASTIINSRAILFHLYFYPFPSPLIMLRQMPHTVSFLVNISVCVSKIQRHKQYNHDIFVMPKIINKS